ncbi:16S rRNA (cytidine(1402)-2'-O)-methyltransferase [Helicobacter didelphidarum]|uniref:16S rRNA (Cytidine(1402)-2'-O)-methyltransferase n=1 Tax=Helicobacter didelphidarum TaxID=2040648 RepID=A0A3D8IMM8_9HELI|nr:16S rRNA (cytidine(1402)-2'-O)-methyltransferase [Helicobacter didelphidarum]RDU66250.1 16S rRNA (cytidine(1402)-2'-O)-methyltransferase [Helicobacter didelphidarum]
MLTFLPTPIGNLSDISLHVLEALNESDIVVCEDTRVTKKLLILLQRNPIVSQHFPMIAPDNKKFLSFHSHNQEKFIQHLTPDFFKQNIVFCTDAGMPNISDPGTLLLQYARSHQIKYQVLLGGSAFSHAFVNSGLEGGFCFLGFLPHKQHERQNMLKESLEFHKTLHIIYYESPKRLRESLKDIALIMPLAKVYLYKELTKLYQSEMIGLAKDILSNLPKDILGEYCIIIQKDDKHIAQNKILSLTQEDILQLDISLKQKSKLLAQISQKNAKEWYALLLEHS